MTETSAVPFAESDYPSAEVLARGKALAEQLAGFEHVSEALNAIKVFEQRPLDLPALAVYVAAELVARRVEVCGDMSEWNEWVASPFEATMGGPGARQTNARLLWNVIRPAA